MCLSHVQDRHSGKLFANYQLPLALNPVALHVTLSLNAQSLYAFNHSSFLCFLRTSEKSSIIFLKIISWFASITQRACKAQSEINLLEVRLIPFLNTSVPWPILFVANSDRGGTVCILG